MYIRIMIQSSSDNENDRPVNLAINANTGHLEVVQWLHAHAYSCTTEAMDKAIGNNHLDVFEWLQTNRTEGCTTWAMDLAAAHGHFEVFKS
jgi:hypothetical protein